MQLIEKTWQRLKEKFGSVSPLSSMPTGHFGLLYKQRARETDEHFVFLRKYICLLRKKSCAWSFTWHSLIWTYSVYQERTLVPEDANLALPAELKLTCLI